MPDCLVLLPCSPLTPGAGVRRFLPALPVIDRAAVGAGECVASQWENDFVSIAQLAQVASPTTPLAVLGDVVEKDLVHLAQVAQQVSIVQVDEILHRVQVAALNKVLPLVQEEQKLLLLRCMAQSQVLLHAQNVLAQFLDMPKVFDKRKQHRVEFVYVQNRPLCHESKKLE